MSNDWIKHVRVKAVIDRLRFTESPTMPVSREEMKKHLPRDGCGGKRWDLRDVGGAGDAFEVTVHDVDSLPAVNAIIDRLRVRMPLKAEPALKILEVAMDVIPHVPGTVDLERVAADVFKGAKFEPSDNSRSSPGRGACRVDGPDAAYLALQRGHTLYVGDKGDPIMVRCYVKRTDNRLPLPLTEHRARYEVQLQDEGVPVLTVAALGMFRFEQMSPMFLARSIRADLSPLAALIAERLPKLRRYPRVVRHARSFSSEAFTKFNKRVFATLEQLTRTVQSERGNPYHPGHLRADLIECSVSADSFFPAVTDVTPAGRLGNSPDLLTTLYVEEKAGVKAA